MQAAGNGRRARLRAQLRAEDGFTLPELLVVVALVPLVLVAMLKLLDTSNQIVPRGVEYANAVAEAGTGSALIMRDLRSAYRIVGTTPNSIRFNAYLNGVDTQVNIQCDVPGTGSYRRCVETKAPVGTTMPAPSAGQVMVDRLLNGTADDPVFDFDPDPIFPSYVRLHVEVPSQGAGKPGLTHAITIDNGTLLRNATLGT